MKIKTTSFFIFLFFSTISFADCITINRITYCGNGKCVALNDKGYCSQYEHGEARIHNGNALCGAGKCLVKGSSLYCSQYSGGDIIENNGALWTGPGECIKYNGNVRCAKEPRGTCINDSGNARCQGGWLKEIPEPAKRCQVGNIL